MSQSILLFDSDMKVLTKSHANRFYPKDCNKIFPNCRTGKICMSLAKGPSLNALLVIFMHELRTSCIQNHRIHRGKFYFCQLFILL